MSNLTDFSNADRIPFMSITYATSDAASAGIANMGDFVVNRKSLGKTIHVIPLAFRYVVTAFGPKPQGGGLAPILAKLTMIEDGVNPGTKPEYIDFKKKYASCDSFANSTEWLLFVKEADCVVIFTLKNTLSSYSGDFEKSLNALIRITTQHVKKTNGNQYYLLVIEPAEGEVPQISSEVVEAFDRPSRKDNDLVPVANR